MGSGTIVGWLPMITPTRSDYPLTPIVWRNVDHPRVRSQQLPVVLASDILLVAASLPLVRDALTGTATTVIAIAGLALKVCRKIDALWIVGGDAVINPLAMAVDS